MISQCKVAYLINEKITNKTIQNMNDVVNIAIYYEKGFECLRNGKNKAAANYFKQSWEAFNNTESMHIPKNYIDMAHEAHEQYISLGNGFDESGFDSIEYGY